jgi:tRNA1Val (adenine37-N6)-methyltransferase
MSNNYFSFKQFTVWQSDCALKVCTDACLFGAWVAAHVKEDAPTSILDIGTGTGLLSLLLAQKIPAAQIDAVEIDDAAAAQAASNALATGWNIKVHNIAIENFSGTRYQHIISNPPFFSNDLKSDDALRNTAMHSTTLTLQSLFSCVVNLLDKNGSFSVLIPYARATELEKLAAQFGLVIFKKALVHQTPTHEPFRAMYILSSAVTSPAVVEQIIIKENEQYSAGFVTYLKDYYLFL